MKSSIGFGAHRAGAPPERVEMAVAAIEREVGAAEPGAARGAWRLASEVHHSAVIHDCHQLGVAP